MKLRPVRFFFLATVFCATFEKLSWNVAGSVSIADILAIGFILSFAAQEITRHDRRFVKTAGVVAAPEDVDGIRDALAGLHDRWQAGSLNGTPLPEDLRERLDRRTRVREYADLLLNLPPGE